MGLETEVGISSLNNLKGELAVKAKHQSLSILDAKFIKHRPNYDISCLSIFDSYYYFYVLLYCFNQPSTEISFRRSRYSEASNFAGFLSFLAWNPCGVICNEK